MFVGKKIICGMCLDEWINESCTAHIGVGDDWATIYSIVSTQLNNGHAERLIRAMRSYYNKRGKVFGTSITLSPAMQHLVKKIRLKEYQ